MQNGSFGADRTDFLQSGVPLSETLPEEAFLSIQTGRLKAVMMALDEMAKAVHGQGPVAAYIVGLKDLLGAVRDDLEVLTRSKAPR